jgi:hypothetical protein
MDHKLLRISSLERDLAQSESSSSFRLNFNNASAVQGVKRIVLKNISIPNVGYNIVSTENDTFSFRVATVQKDILVPEGFYSINELITALEADAEAIAVGLSITLNTITGKLQFTSTTPIQYLSAPTNSMARTLGILQGTVSDVALFDAEGLPDLTGDTELYIASEALSDGANLVDAVLQAVPVLGIVPIRVPFGSIQHIEVSDADVDEVVYLDQDTGKSIQSMDIKVYNDRGKIVNLQGLDWVMILKLYYN